MFHFTVPLFYILNIFTSDPDWWKCVFAAPVIIDPGELQAGDAIYSARVRGRQWRNSELCITFIYNTFFPCELNTIWSAYFVFYVDGAHLD